MAHHPMHPPTTNQPTTAVTYAAQAAGLEVGLRSELSTARDEAARLSERCEVAAHLATALRAGQSEAAAAHEAESSASAAATAAALALSSAELQMAGQQRDEALVELARLEAVLHESGAVAQRRELSLETRLAQAIAAGEQSEASAIRNDL